MTPLDIAVALLIVFPAFPALAALILVRHIGSRSPSLNERALVAIRDWIVASGAAILALGRLGIFTVPRELAIPMLVVMMLLVSLPSMYWLWLYHRGAFR